MTRLTQWFKTRILKRNCLNCAYLQHDHPEFGEDVPHEDWFGYSASCWHKMWNIGFIEVPMENILERAYHLSEQDPRRQHKTKSELVHEFGEDFGKTRIPLSDGYWHDLAEFHCRNFRNVNNREGKTLEKCWEEQQKTNLEAKDRRRFWINALIGAVTAVAVIASAIFHWLEWRGAP